MRERKLTLSLKEAQFDEVSAICGKRKKFSSKQEFLQLLVDNYFESKEISVKDTGTKKEGRSSFRDKFFKD